MRTRRQATPMFTTICVLVGVLVIIQLWLLSASVESVLGDAPGPAVPATIASLVLFALSAGLLRYALVVDRKSER